RPSLLLLPLTFFVHDTPTTETSPLSLHDALPIFEPTDGIEKMHLLRGVLAKETELTNGPGKLTKALAITMDYYGHPLTERPLYIDRKSTRLNSSHVSISYAVFCLKKKKKTEEETQ